MKKRKEKSKKQETYDLSNLKEKLTLLGVVFHGEIPHFPQHSKEYDSQLVMSIMHVFNLRFALFVTRSSFEILRREDNGFFIMDLGEVTGKSKEDMTKIMSEVLKTNDEKMMDVLFGRQACFVMDGQERLKSIKQLINERRN
jgi:hypothetical protein